MRTKLLALLLCGFAVWVFAQSLMMGVYSKGIPTRGLTHYWPLNECSGTTARDLIGGLNGTWSGTAVGTGGTYYSTGRDPGICAGVFDGSTTKLDLGSSSLATQASAKSLFAWIFVDTATNVRFGRIFANQIVGAQWTLATCPDGWGEAMAVGGTPDGNTHFGCSGANTVQRGVWAHVGWTFDGTTFVIYVNGVAQAQNTTDSSFSFTNGAVTIGFRTSGSTTGNFAGKISNVPLYNRAITAREVKQLMQATSPVNRRYWDSAVLLDAGYRMERPGYLGVDGSGNRVLLMGTREHANYTSDSTAGWFYRSLDAGRTWTKLVHATTTSGILSEPVTPALGSGTAYVATCDSHVLKTTDWGTTWTTTALSNGNSPLSPGTWCLSYGIIYTAAGRLLVSDTAGDVWYSDDGGGSWTQVHVNSGGLLFFTEMANGNLIVVGIDGKAWLSTNGGVSWTGSPLLSSVLLEDVCRIGAAEALVLNEEGKVWGTTDSGATWAARNGGAALGPPTTGFKMALSGCAKDSTGLIHINAEGDPTAPHTYSGPMFTTSNNFSTYSVWGPPSSIHGAGNDMVAHILLVDDGTEEYISAGTYEGYALRKQIRR